MPLVHNLKCPVDMMRPRPVGIDDRTGFLVYLDDMDFQHQWAGNALVNLRILTHQDYLDKPAEFLRTFKFSPEPAPLVNARPTQYATQNLGGVPAPTNINNLVEGE